MIFRVIQLNNLVNNGSLILKKNLPRISLEHQQEWPKNKNNKQTKNKTTLDSYWKWVTVCPLFLIVQEEDLALNCRPRDTHPPSLQEHLDKKKVGSNETLGCPIQAPNLLHTHIELKAFPSFSGEGFYSPGDAKPHYIFQAPPDSP